MPAKPREARMRSDRPAFFRPAEMFWYATWGRWSLASVGEDSIQIALRRCGTIGRRRLGRRRPTEGETLHAERGLVERDLLVAAELVGQLLPGRRDIVGALLRRGLAGEGLRQLVLGEAVILEDAGDARLDRPVRVVVGVELRVEIVGD